MDVSKLDLYGILGVSPSASTNEILKSYRKQALKCHPDKNPDNPQAAELFHQLTKALEVLSDAAARAAYDKVLRARDAARLRHRELDSKRRKFKDDLEQREKAAANKQATPEPQHVKKDAAKRLQEEIERLRKEGSRLVKSEQERLQKEIATERAQHLDDFSSVRLKVTWQSAKEDVDNGGYDEESLRRIFSKYGTVNAVLVSKKKHGSALVEFASRNAAIIAMHKESGHSDNPLTLMSLSGDLSSDAECQSTQKATSHSASYSFDASKTAPATSQVPATSTDDFESVVLMRMRQAEERRRLAEQMAEQD